MRAPRLHCVTALIAVLILLAAGCSTIENGRCWGEDATLAPGLRRLGEAAKNAAGDPKVWGPALGAVLLQIDGWDRRLSDWAVRHAPVYGSPVRARKASDALITVSNVTYWGSVLATPCADQPLAWLTAKAKGSAVGVAANQLTFHLIRFLQETTRRKRLYDDADLSSFPSLHTSYAASQVMSASRNVECCAISESAISSIVHGLDSITLAMAWARVEGRRHYPSDVLAGISLGYFLSAFFNDAFLGTGVSREISIDVEASSEYLGFRMRWEF